MNLFYFQQKRNDINHMRKNKIDTQRYNLTVQKKNRLKR